MAGEIYSINIMDWSRETSSVGVRVGAVTAVSLPGLLSEIDDFREATEALILGEAQSDQLVAFKTNLSNAVPTDPAAQRENKWLVTYADDTQFFDPPINAIPNEGFGRKFQIEIPTANLSTDLLLPNSDEADLTATEWVAWVLAFESLARSPHGGVPLVLRVKAVGRNI